jgi:hypothetical protein
MGSVVTPAQAVVITANRHGILHLGQSIPLIGTPAPSAWFRGAVLG